MSPPFSALFVLELNGETVQPKVFGPTDVLRSTASVKAVDCLSIGA
jgi:hypothetical protein